MAHPFRRVRETQGKRARIGTSITIANLATLSSLIEDLKNDPNLCKSDRGIFCSWVPAGIAVRAEQDRNSLPALS